MNSSRLFLISTGILSLTVVLYASFMHGTLLVMAAASPDQMTAFCSRLFGNPAFIGLHVAVCILGPILAILFIVHAFQNPRIPKLHSFLWLPALACGYGLIFYWYLHILHGHRRNVLPKGMLPPVPFH
jgi:hypothetical protein